MNREFEESRKGRSPPFTKWIAMLLVLATMLSLALPAMAAENGTLTKSRSLNSQLYFWGGETLNFNFTYADGTKGTASIGGFNIHYINGKVAYCIQPGVESVHNSAYTGEEAGSTNFWNRKLTADQRKAISLILLYGAPNNLSSSNTDTRFGYEGATQLMIWEIILGLRSATPPYARINNKLYSNFKNSDFPSFVKGYDAIADKLAKHKTIPSFSSGDEALAPTYQLKYDAATGMCTGDLTDKNGVLDAYTFTAPNVTFTRDGNTLHVSALLTAFASGSILASAKGSSLKEGSAVLYCWTAADSTKQTLIQTFKTSAEPATAYFKLEAEMISTALTILKEADDGHVADIPFTVTDQSGSRVFEGKTDSKGELLVPGLVIGETYVITESVPEGYKAEKASETVTITSGVNKVTFRNTPITGGLVIYKSSDAHDVPLEGAVFELRDSDGNLIERLITDEDGKASVFDLPYGDYFLEEVEAPEGFKIDETIYSFSIQDDGQVFEFSAVNEPIPGSISIRKVDPSGRPLAGVTFLLEYSEDRGKEWKAITKRADGYPMTVGTTTSDVTDGKLTTDENGKVTFEGLMIRSQLGEILYRLTETETVPGYSLLPESILVGELTEEETTVSFEVVNEPVTVLPFTGRAGFKVIYLLSLLTIPAAVVLIKKRKVE